MTSLEKVKIISNALENRKGIDIKILMVEKLTVLAEYFILVSGSNATQLRALADEVDFEMSKVKIESQKIEGYNSNGWILMDYNDIIVHIFHENKRDFYGLERIWADAEIIEI